MKSMFNNCLFKKVLVVLVLSAATQGAFAAKIKPIAGSLSAETCYQDIVTRFFAPRTNSNQVNSVLAFSPFRMSDPISLSEKDPPILFQWSQNASINDIANKSSGFRFLGLGTTQRASLRSDLEDAFAAAALSKSCINKLTWNYRDNTFVYSGKPMNLR